VKVNNKVVYQNLNQLFNESREIKLKSGDRWVIFSDLHMGDGGSTDDFKANSDLFQRALKEHYYQRDYSLILNGDVEELQRFSLKKISKQWREVYSIFDAFASDQKLIKTIGNHDLGLAIMESNPFEYELLDSARLRYKDNDLFIFHGHQASKKYQTRNQMIGFTLKYLANPLGIKNYSVAHDSRKQYNIEKRVYGYSAYNKIASIIGHTHRPLFESLHKVERLKYKIEQLCRDLASMKNPNKEITASIKANKKDLKKYYKNNLDTNFQNYVYNTIFHIPCLFNSGCVIGKRGMTCLEIEDEKIRLVHWFDKKISKKYLQQSGYEPEPLAGTDYYRMVLNEETLDYIFTRIKFLA
jgi:UDP-2,3-diacylglucosamine pyrophosphatase LpxH